jgi:hypothetical protein
VSDAVALLEMFTCERLHARMTVNACARQWLKANTATDRHGKRVEPPPWDSLHHCLRCPVGAQRCGRTIDPIADAVAALKPICPRCLRVADRIVNARGERPLCVSCYNRDREVRIGKNAKGGVPVLTLAKLRPVAIQVIDGDQTRIVRMDRAASEAELIINICKKAKGPLIFARVPMPPPGVPLNPRFIEDVEDEEEAPPPAGRRGCLAVGVRGGLLRIKDTPSRVAGSGPARRRAAGSQ